jgi:hypothetical protein
MTWEEALEAHVSENAGQFDASAAGRTDMQAFAVTQFGVSHRRLDRLEGDVKELKADVRSLRSDLDALRSE